MCTYTNTNYYIIQRKLFGIKFKQGCIPDEIFFRSLDA